MDLNSIRYIVTIAEEKSFSKASEKLYISQPALSQYIKNIENRLNTPIFYRNTHSVEPTYIGSVIVNEGKLLLEQSDKMFKKIYSLSEEIQNTVRLGIANCYSKYYLPQILSNIKKHCPHINIEVTEKIPELLEPSVINNDMDLCLTPEDPKNPKLAYETLCDEEIMLAVPHNHPFNINNSRKNSSVSLVNFKDDAFVLKMGAPKLSKLILSSLFEEAGFYPKKIFETINWDTVNSMVSDGVGVGFIPHPLIEYSYVDNSPTYYHIESRHSTFRKYSIAYLKGAELPTAVNQIIDCIKRTFL